MRSRLAILAAAVVLGVLAAVLTGRYLASLERGVSAKDEPVEVLVAQDALAKGMSAEELIERKLVAPVKVPRRYVAEGAVSAVSTLQGKVLAEEVSKGEQITQARFRYPREAGLAFTVPEGHVAVAISSDAVKGVAGLIKPQDFVMVVATLDPGPDGKPLTRVILDKVRVLAVGQSVGAEAAATEGQRTGGGGLAAASARQDQAGPVASTVTLALTPKDLEKLVFAEEKGNIRLALIGSGDTEVGRTPGRTLQTLFKE